MRVDAFIRDDETIDPVLDGKFRIIQRERGYRFSLDALLLAHFVALRNGDDVIELGTGSGIIAIILARRHHLGRIVGVEIQKSLFDVALRNVTLNDEDGRVEVIRGDVRRPASFCKAQSFSVAVFNPPYRRMHAGRVNPDAEKAAARHEIFGTVGDFIAAAAWALRPGGRMYAIYPATRMIELLSKMRSAGIEPKRLCPVYPRMRASAVFVLVEGARDGGEELNMTPPLIIEDEQGDYTKETMEIFRGLSSSELPGDG